MDTRCWTIAFFITLGAALISVILLLYIGWVLLNWRAGILLFLGALLLALVLSGVMLNALFLVREIHAMSSMTPSSTPLRMNSRRRSHPYGCISKPFKPTATDDAKRREFYRTTLAPRQPEVRFHQRRTRGGGGGIGDARTRT
jgi:hypothetical protein